MFENMSEFVGYAMHDDLMMHTATKVRLAEAMAMRKPQSVRTRARTCRIRIAEALIALATRIAPSPQERTIATTPSTVTR
jgi:hypothetical protein